MHREYVARKAYDKALQSWTVRLTNRGHLLGVFAAKQTVLERQHISMGLHAFLGGADEQLVIRMWTGGKNCCSVYWIAELSPVFHLVFNGRDYDRLRDSGDGYLQAADLDGDGQAEFWQDSTTYDYFGASFADSPSLTIYFKYDRDEGAYRPANAKVWPVIVQQMSPLLKNIQRLNSQGEFFGYESEGDDLHRQHYRRDILSVTLAEIYAGREKEGWAFFEEQYRLRDKAEWRTALKSKLKQDTQFCGRPKP